MASLSSAGRPGHGWPLRIRLAFRFVYSTPFANPPPLQLISARPILITNVALNDAELLHSPFLVSIRPTISPVLKSNISSSVQYRSRVGTDKDNIECWAFREWLTPIWIYARVQPDPSQPPARVGESLGLQFVGTKFITHSTKKWSLLLSRQWI